MPSSLKVCRAKNGLGKQGEAQVKAWVGRLGGSEVGWDLASKLTFLVASFRGISMPFCIQMWPVGSLSTGPMTVASSTASALSSGTLGAMASCYRPRRSSPRPRRCGWQFGPS